MWSFLWRRWTKNEEKKNQLKNKTIKEEEKSVLPIYFGLLWLVIVSTDCNLFNAWYLSLFAALLPLFLPLCFTFLNLCMWLMWSPSALINWTLSLLRSQAFFSLKVLLLLLAFILFVKCFMLRSCYCLSQSKLFQQWRIWNAMMAQWTDHTSCQRVCCPSSRSPMRGWNQWTRTRQKDWYKEL